MWVDTYLKSRIALIGATLFLLRANWRRRHCNAVINWQQFNCDLTRALTCTCKCNVIIKWRAQSFKVSEMVLPETLPCTRFTINTEIRSCPSETPSQRSAEAGSRTNRAPERIEDVLRELRLYRVLPCCSWWSCHLLNITRLCVEKRYSSKEV